MDLYTQLRGAASLHVTGSKDMAQKGVKKDWLYATRGSNGPIQVKSVASLNVTGSKGPTCGVQGGK